MQDANDNDGIIGLLEIDHVRADRRLEISRPNMLGGSGMGQPSSQTVTTPLNFSEVAQGLFLAPTPDSKVEKLVEIPARCRRELQPQNYARAFSMM